MSQHGSPAPYDPNDCPLGKAYLIELGKVKDAIFGNGQPGIKTELAKNTLTTQQSLESSRENGEKLTALEHRVLGLEKKVWMAAGAIAVLQPFAEWIIKKFLG